MENEEPKELTPRDNDQSRETTIRHRLHDAQVPPSLLPMVLLRLGLSSDSLSPEISVDTLVELLHSEQWEDRLNAVRMLGHLGSRVPVDLLAMALDDPDGSVRAAAVFALGNAGRHAPLHRLITALNDTDWHVRETAVLALSQQGERVPQEVLQVALYDADSSVRDAASLALRQYTPTSESEHPAAYEGQLWEQRIMQQKEGHHSGATHSSSHEEWSDTFVAHNRDAGSLSRVLREQQQSYAAQGPTSDERWQSYTQHAPLEPSSGEQMQMFAPPLEASPDEQTSIERQQDPIAGSSQHSEYSASALAAQGEKITSFSRQRRSSKGWWILIVVVALLFFMLGRIVTVSTSPVPISFTSAIPVSHEHKLPTGFSQNDKGIPFENHLLNSQSLLQARQMIADGLHLSPDAITQQLQAGHTMQDIASTQGVDPDQLHNIELKAITLLINTEAQVGDIDASYASDTINHLQNSSDTLDNMAALLFTSPQLNTTKQSPGASQILSNPALSYQAQHQIASDLHLTSQDVTKQLQSGKSLPDIAAAQGVSNNQLHSIELKAYSNVANTAVKSGDLTSGAADAWLKALSNNSQNLDQTTQDLFLNNNQSPNN